MTTTRPIDRRAFLKVGAVAGGGLLLTVYAPEVGALGAERGLGPDGAGTLAPNAFVKIDTDGTVTITVAHSDMGQGVRTALPMIVADELDADWSSVRIVQADAHPDRYGRMMTVGSTSVRNGSWTPLRKAGAAAREMLVAAAAAQWSVSPRIASHGTRARLSRRQQALGELRRAGRSRGDAPRPAGPDAQEGRRLHDHRDVAVAAGRSRQGHGAGEVRHRCTPGRDALRHRRAPAGLREQGQVVRRHQGARCFRRARRRAADDRDRGRG